MASEKQLEYLKKLNVWKAAGLDLDKVALLPEEEASALIDELKARKSVSKQKQVQASPAVAAVHQQKSLQAFDDNWRMQLGMAKKDVHATFARYGKCTTDDNFKQTVFKQWQVYNEIDMLVAQFINRGAE